MEKDKMSKESREEALERILAETARTPYKPGQYRRKSETAGSPQRKPAVPQNKSVVNKLNKPDDQTHTFAKKTKTVMQNKSASENNRIEEKKLEEKRLLESESIRKTHQAKASMHDFQQERVNVIESENMVYPANDTIYDAQEFLQDEEYEVTFEDNGSFKSGKKILNAVLDIAEIVITAGFVVMLIFTYIIGIASVSGDSMKPTLNTKDKLIILQAGYSPQRGDVVVVNDETANLIGESGDVISKEGLGCKIVKRVIAVGGDTIDFDFENGIVSVNGTKLDEKYISEPTTRDEFAFEYPLTIPDGYVFVMGDNRNISKDSRHTDVGLVSENEIMGKVMLRMYPFDSFGTID